MDNESELTHPAVVSFQLGNLQAQAVDHEHRLRKVENSIARSAWLSGVLTPIVTGLIVTLVLRFNGG